VLERIEYAKATQEEAEAELAVLVDQAVILASVGRRSLAG